MSNINKRRVRKSEPPLGIKDPQIQNVNLVKRDAPLRNTAFNKNENPEPQKPLYSRSQLKPVDKRKSHSPSPKPSVPQHHDKRSASKPKPNEVASRPRAVSAIAPKQNGPSTNASRPRSATGVHVNKDLKPSKPSSPRTKNPSENNKQKPSKSVQGVSYKSNKDSVELPKITQKPPVPNKVQKTPSAVSPKANGALKAAKSNDSSNKTPTAVVAPVQSMTVKPLKLGHNFEPHELTDWVTWCDACGGIILSIGMFGKCVSCKKCKMVCHVKCAQTVSLTCEADEERNLKADNVSAVWYKTIVQETKDESTLKEYNTIKRVIPKDELKKRIESFNLTVKGSQQMTLLEDNETFRGFIRVQINLSRPVSVQNSTKTLNNKDKLKRSQSFYIDKGAVKALYLTSTHTSEEVIEALLKKYSIRDNVQKFALFEKQVRDGEHIVLRKMLPKERPLFLRLLWGKGNSNDHAFILQENETREIQWESFSPAELNTFLKILNKEESDHRKNIEERYEKNRQTILKAIQHQKTHGGK